MGIIITIAIIVLISFAVSSFSLDKINEDNKNKFSKLGYNYIKLLGANYKGGIKNISINNQAITVILLKEGLNFSTGLVEKTILFKDITNISLQSKQYIQNQVSLGKLIVFGVLAFGMDGNKNNVNDEYIVFKVNEDEEYNILIQAYESASNQEIFNEILLYKNEIAKESV